MTLSNTMDLTPEGGGFAPSDTHSLDSEPPPIYSTFDPVARTKIAQLLKRTLGGHNEGSHDSNDDSTSNSNGGLPTEWTPHGLPADRGYQTGNCCCTNRYDHYHNNNRGCDNFSPVLLSYSNSYSNNSSRYSNTSGTSGEADSSNSNRRGNPTSHPLNSATNPHVCMRNTESLSSLELRGLENRAYEDEAV